MRKGVIAAALAAGLVTSTAALGGVRGYDWEVGLISSGTYRGAYGSFGAARASSDSNQYIGCVTYGTYGYCYAADRTGQAVSCSWSTPNLAAAVQSITADSYIDFMYDSSQGSTCSFLSVANDSRNAPVLP